MRHVISKQPLMRVRTSYELLIISGLGAALLLKHKSCNTPHISVKDAFGSYFFSKALVGIDQLKCSSNK